MPLILLTNDDGIHAPGIHAMRRELEKTADVEIVAPHTEQSGAAHALTIDHPLRIERVTISGEVTGYSVSGTPADCVKVGVAHHLTRPPDLVVSGINYGQNAGVNVLYSGTVAAALEGAMLGVPSAAVSVARSEGKPWCTDSAELFGCAARIASRIINKIVAAASDGGDSNVPPNIAWNINIPGLPEDRIKGIRLTSQSVQAYIDGYDKRTDPRGGAYLWINGQIDRGLEPDDTDLAALRDDYVSVTPLSYDLTARGDWSELAAALKEA